MPKSDTLPVPMLATNKSGPSYLRKTAQFPAKSSWILVRIPHTSPTFVQFDRAARPRRRIGTISLMFLPGRKSIFRPCRRPHPSMKFKPRQCHREVHTMKSKITRTRARRLSPPLGEAPSSSGAFPTRDCRTRR